MEKILVVEDEEAIRDGLVDALEFHGYRVDTAEDGIVAEKQVGTKRYDLIILDLMLPGKDGFTLCEEWRKSGHATPILMLTARGEEEHRVKGLKLGADDYVTKPFSVKELIARVEAILRRCAPDGNLADEMAFGNGAVNFDRREFVYADDIARLTELDIKMIRVFVCNPGRIISREEMLERVWGMAGDEVDTRKVDMQLVKLRKKITGAGGNDELIKTVRGAGYIYAGK